jgi:hypothetical protein
VPRRSLEAAVVVEHPVVVVVVEPPMAVPDLDFPPWDLPMGWELRRS